MYVMCIYDGGQYAAVLYTANGTYHYYIITKNALNFVQARRDNHSATIVSASRLCRLCIPSGTRRSQLNKLASMLGSYKSSMQLRSVGRRRIK